MIIIVMFKNLRIIIQTRYGIGRMTQVRKIMGYEEEYKPKEEYHVPCENDEEYEEEFKPKEDYNVEIYKDENKISVKDNEKI